jgi:hypothetical protein
MEAFEGSDVDVVLAAMAGHGSAEVLEFLDPRVFISNPKPFIGFAITGGMLYIGAARSARVGGHQLGPAVAPTPDPVGD